jgi:hypothetical protein
MAADAPDRRSKVLSAAALSGTTRGGFRVHSRTATLRSTGWRVAGLLEPMGMVDFFKRANAVASELQVGYEPPVRGRKIAAGPEPGP